MPMNFNLRPDAHWPGSNAIHGRNGAVVLVSHHEFRLGCCPQLKNEHLYLAPEPPEPPEDLLRAWGDFCPQDPEPYPNGLVRLECGHWAEEADAGIVPTPHGDVLVCGECSKSMGIIYKHENKTSL
jgi:hypothetical protein